MVSMDPSGYSGAVSAADAPVMERAAFLQRTYTWLFGGILGFAATLWAAGEIEPVQQAMMFLWQSWWLGMAVILGVSYAMRAVATNYPLNAIMFGVTVVVWGLLLGPLVHYAAGSHPGTVESAAGLTAIIFLGLTIYVFKSGKDFSFMGGALFMVGFGMIGVLIAGMIFGFHIGIWFSVLGAMLFAGFILYDTSKILRTYPTNMHISAAATLFVDVVMMFQYILMILISRDD